MKTIFVVGDVMLDSYYLGHVLRVSPEAPIPVVNHRETDYKLGGAANVAKNLAASDINVRLFGVVGEDPSAEILRGLLESSGIASGLIVSKLSPTINKLRVCGEGQQIVRVDFESAFQEQDSHALARKVIDSLAECAVLVLSDYAKGTLRNISDLISEAKRRGIPVLVDPKGNDFDKYRDASILTPNRSEFEDIVGSCPNDEELFLKAQCLRDDLGLRALVVTLSERGMMLFERDREPLHIAALAREVVDVTGAGDTAIAWMARGLLTGKSIEKAVVQANIACSIAVSKRGAQSVSLGEVLAKTDEMEGARPATTLFDFVSTCREQDKSIVFTNGCFDILHEGHVSYLEEARKHGDKLIVAINDDESVRRLKGDSRPINPLESRIRVLLALSSVDFVVSFNEDSPLRLIEQITPDVLVKGGDYSVSEIVGNEYVRRSGGQVLTIEFVEGFSTSRLIEAIAIQN